MNDWPDNLSAPTPEHVEQTMSAFWSTLSQLPDYVTRAENLLLFGLIHELRRQVIEMMLAANGIRYPDRTRHLNLYLGESQQVALEKTLLLPGTPSGAPTESLLSVGTKPEPAGWDLGAALVAQAVGLVVIYRWYAPQLGQKYGVPMPVKMESQTLSTLQKNLDVWPLTITTD